MRQALARPSGFQLNNADATSPTDSTESLPRRRGRLFPSPLELGDPFVNGCASVQVQGLALPHSHEYGGIPRRRSRRIRAHLTTRAKIRTL